MQPAYQLYLPTDLISEYSLMQAEYRVTDLLSRSGAS